MPEEVSLATVAARAGVSVSTVSRVVNGETWRASAATVARVRGAIEAVGYRPNPVGRALRRRQSQVVAMLVANLDNPAMATIAASTEAALRSAGYVMILCDTHDRADLQDEYLRAMRAQMVRGFVMVASVPSKGLSEMSAQGAPMIFVNRRDPTGRGPFVGIDDRKAGAAVADRFVAEGRRSPAVVVPTQGSPATRDRIAGFLERLSERGTPVEKVIAGEAAGLSHLDVGYAAAEQIFSRGNLPDAVLCVSDQIAYGVRRRALERGLDIPRDCFLVSIDGSPLNKWVAPWLASVEIPYTAYGEQVLASLNAIWAGEAGADRLLAYRF
jgi:LacI family transcriptional regulator